MIIKIQITNTRILNLSQPFDKEFYFLVEQAAKKTKKRFFDSIRKILVDYDRIFIYTNMQLSGTNMGVMVSYFIGTMNKESTFKTVIECSSGQYPDTENFTPFSEDRYKTYLETFQKQHAGELNLFGIESPIAYEDLPKYFREGLEIV